MPGKSKGSGLTEEKGFTNKRHNTCPSSSDSEEGYRVVLTRSRASKKEEMRDFPFSNVTERNMVAIPEICRKDRDHRWLINEKMEDGGDTGKATCTVSHGLSDSISEISLNNISQNIEGDIIREVS